MSSKYIYPLFLLPPFLLSLSLRLRAILCRLPPFILATFSLPLLRIPWRVSAPSCPVHPSLTRRRQALYQDNTAGTLSWTLRGQLSWLRLAVAQLHAAGRELDFIVVPRADCSTLALSPHTPFLCHEHLLMRDTSLRQAASNARFPSTAAPAPASIRPTPRLALL